MSSELARRDPHQLATAAPGGVVAYQATELERFHFNEQQVQIFKATYCPGFTDPEVAFAKLVCEHHDMNPFLNEIYFMLEKNDRQNSRKVTVMIGIAGWLKRARKGGYMGRKGPYFRAKGGGWQDYWDEGYPHEGKVEVYFRGMLPYEKRMRFDEVARRYPSGDLMGVWAKMPIQMFEIRMMAHAIRDMCPQAVAGLIQAESSEPLALAANPDPMLRSLQEDMGHQVVDASPVVYSIGNTEASAKETPDPAVSAQVALQETPANPIEAFRLEWLQRGFDGGDKSGMKDYLRRSLGREPRNARTDADGYKADVLACYQDFQRQPAAQKAAEEQFLGDDEALMDALESALGYRPVSLILTTAREFDLLATPAPEVAEADFELE